MARILKAIWIRAGPLVTGVRMRPERRSSGAGVVNLGLVRAPQVMEID